MKIQCFKCRGRGYCNRGFCVIRQKLDFQKSFNKTAKQNFFGGSYNVFVGRFGHPRINVGLLNTEEINNQVDNPKGWVQDNLDIQEIMQHRSSLINSNFKAQIKGFNDRFMETAKEVSLSKEKVDVEINLNKTPKFSLSFSQHITPFGPTVKLEKARITENPKIPHKVEYVLDDDLKASEQLNILYKKRFDEHYLTKIFSMGNTGLETNQKLVPTRWSITGVDDTIGKQLIKETKSHSIINEYMAFYGGYLGNHYLILCFPEPWSYELFESLAGTTSYTTDYENYYGRKTYANDTAGGYYAARLGILEQLSKMKRQASVLALRFITSDYYAPLGVWVCREAARKSMNSKPLRFESRELMMRYANLLIKKDFKMDTNKLIEKSHLMKNIKQQKKLFDFQFN